MPAFCHHCCNKIFQHNIREFTKTLLDLDVYFNLHLHEADWAPLYYRPDLHNLPGTTFYSRIEKWVGLKVPGTFGGNGPNEAWLKQSCCCWQRYRAVDVFVRRYFWWESMSPCRYYSCHLFVTNVAFVEGVKCPFLYPFECLVFGAHFGTNPAIKQIIVREKIIFLDAQRCFAKNRNTKQK